MRILLVSPLPPPAGGIATWTEKYRDYCLEKGIPLSIVNNAVQGSRAKQLNTKRRLLDEVKRTWYVLKELQQKIKMDHPDVVHLNTPCGRFGIFRDLLCVWYTNRKGIPVILHCHCNIQDQLAGKAAERAFCRMAKKSQKVLVLNEPSFAYASRFALDKAMIVPNFIESRCLTAWRTTAERIRTVVFVGYVQKTKGVWEILQAAEQLPEMEFLLVGAVKDDCFSQRRPANVRFLGPQPHEAVFEILRGADVFLFPSYSEGFSNALTEAMASGLPVIATDVGSNKEMIENNGGMIVPVGDGDAIVKALRMLDGSIEQRSAMSAWNVEKVRRCYLRDSVMGQLLALYEGIIG